MKSITFSIEIPKPDGWQPKIKKPKKVFLVGYIFSFFVTEESKRLCKDCKFNSGLYCIVGTHYATKGINAVCHEGELWENKNN